MNSLSKRTRKNFFAVSNLKLIFMTKNNLPANLKETNSNRSNRRRSNWTPPDGQFTSVDLFVKKCRVDIQKLNFNKSLKFSNLSKEEWTAHQNLKTRDDIVHQTSRQRRCRGSFGAPTFTNKKLLDN